MREIFSYKSLIFSDENSKEEQKKKSEQEIFSGVFIKEEEILPGLPRENILLDGSLENEICIHGVFVDMCAPCDRISAVRELKPFIDDYREALERWRSPKITRKSQVIESDVCPQHFDFRLVNDYENRIKAIESKYYVAEVVFKRILRLSYGVIIPKTTQGSLLHDDCIVDVLKCIPGGLLKTDWKTIYDVGKSNGHHWLLANNFLIYIPQKTFNTKRTRKDKNLILQEKINYQVKTTQRDLFK